ncbi:MAG: cytochrome-c peroxidase [Sandaracinaceae bacterium]
MVSVRRHVLLCLWLGACSTPHTRPEPLELADVPALAGDSLPAISGGTLLVTQRGLIVAGDADHAVLWVLDPSVPAVVGHLRLRPSDEPGRMAESDDGRVHVVLRRAGELLSIDPATATVLSRRPVCAAPRGVAWDAERSLLWVACMGGALLALDPAGDVLRRFSVERDLRDVVVTEAGVFVSRFRRAELLTVDPNDGAVLDRRRAADRFLPSRAGPQLVANVAWRSRRLPDGGVVMLHQLSVSSEVDVDGSGYAGLFCRNGVVSPAVTRFPPSGGAPQGTGPMGFAPLALDVVQLSTTGGARTVVAIGASEVGGQDGLWSTLEVSAAPGAPCAALEFPTAGAPPAIAVADWEGRLVTQHRNPTRIAVEDGPVFEMSTRLADDRGHALFHAGTPSFVACASCHPEGGEDGHTWNFTGIGLRRTQTMLGGLLETAPFHWSGDQPDMTAIMVGSFEGRMRGAHPSDAEIMEVGRWLDGLASPPPDPVEPAAGSRGRAVFEDPDVGCANCHAGSARTERTNRDVGTGDAYQVPSLRGVVHRAPYFHDGCAPSLEEVVDGACGTLDRHGVTSSLEAGSRADLLAYLRSL